MDNQPTTREEWLVRATDMLRATFNERGFTLGPVHVSCGWPATGGTSRKRRRVGECWKSEASDDGYNHIFISPLLHEEDEVLGTLLHELCHAVDDCQSDHGASFRRIATKMGLEGKMTATYPGEDLVFGVFQAIIDALGSYPHSPLKPGEKVKKQSTRMKKMECEACGYVARTTRKWLEEFGTVICPCNEERMELEEERDEDG